MDQIIKDKHFGEVSKIQKISQRGLRSSGSPTSKTNNTTQTRQKKEGLLGSKMIVNEKSNEKRRRNRSKSDTSTQSLALVEAFVGRRSGDDTRLKGKGKGDDFGCGAEPRRNLSMNPLNGNRMTTVRNNKRRKSYGKRNNKNESSACSNHENPDKFIKSNQEENDTASSNVTCELDDDKNTTQVSEVCVNENSDGKKTYGKAKTAERKGDDSIGAVGTFLSKKREQ